MELTMPPRMLVQSKGRFRERKKLTMVKAQVYWKATKSKKSQMLDDFCESTGYCRRYAARVLHQAGQRYLLRDCVLVADPTKHIQRHRPPRYGSAVLQALITIWAASTFLGPVRLAAGMALFVENLTAHGHLPIDEETWINKRTNTLQPSITRWRNFRQGAGSGEAPEFLDPIAQNPADPEVSDQGTRTAPASALGQGWHLPAPGHSHSAVTAPQGDK